jgi:hypothetical protein
VSQSVSRGRVILFVTSGAVVRTALDSSEDPEEPSQRELDVGAIVGKTENLFV